MTDPEEAEEEAASLTRVRVVDEGIQRPFMRGILVHSLKEQGVAFETAYEIAQEVWLRIQGQPSVTKAELRQHVTALLNETPLAELNQVDADWTGPLEILGKDGRWPFNQGRLQQSLLAAGLLRPDVFKAVVEIEGALRERGERQISRDVVRKMVAESLESRFGRNSARRYLNWRSYQNEDERPIVLLLGGTSGVGKSSLALEVARRLSIGRVLSTDSIRDVMRVMLTDDLVPTLHVSSFEAHTKLTREVPDRHDPIIEGFLEQSRTILVGVSAVIERAIAEGTSTVLDGVSMVPGLLDAAQWQDRAHVFFLLAADEDRESLYGHLVARAHGKGARASERYVRNFKEIFAIQECLLERAEEFEVPVVDVQDLDGASRKVVKHVVDQLGQRRAAEVSRVD